MLPYLSGVPSAGRSLDQRHLDLRLLAERGGEADLRCVVGSYGVRVRLGVRLGGALLEGIRKPASCLGLNLIPSAQAIVRSEVLGAVSQNGVEGEPVRFRVSGVARFPCTSCIHDAAYLSIAVTNACAKVHRGGPFGMILGHEHLSYAGFDM